MNLLLTRGAVIGEGQMGRLSGDFDCDTLECYALMIPPGTYPVTLTTSERARTGVLWTPRPDFALPLVQNVPGRSGIRIHAGNTAADVTGCIALGRASAVPGVLRESRSTLTACLERMAHVSVVWLEVVA